MKPAILIPLLLIFSIHNAYSQKVDTLNNEKIIRLSKMGLQPSVLITKIQTSYSLFDVSADGLITLSDSGVHADVINEMINTATAAENALASQKNSNDPLSMHQPGIYYYDPSNTDQLVRRVDPTITSSTKAGGFGSALAQSYSYGLANDQIKSTLAGGNSRLQIKDSNPIFFFYFNPETSMSQDNWFFATASSPNEFLLIKLTERKDSREAVIGTANYYGSNSGVSGKITMGFTYTNPLPGVYKLTLDKPLKDGEYCFIYASSTPSRFDNNKVFDFGIQAETTTSTK